MLNVFTCFICINMNTNNISLHRTGKRFISFITRFNFSFVLHVISLFQKIGSEC